MRIFNNAEDNEKSHESYEYGTECLVVHAKVLLGAITNRKLLSVID